MALLHRTSTLLPLLGLACLSLNAMASESSEKARVVASASDASRASDKAKIPSDELLPLCTPGLSQGGADKGALGLYDIGGGKLAADGADRVSAAKCLKATPGGLSLNVDSIALNLGGIVQYLGLNGTSQRVIRAGTINPALCESYLTTGSEYALELRNSNNDIQGTSGLLPGVASLSYRLSTRSFEPDLMQAAYGPWLRCFDATVPNVAVAPLDPDTVFGASFENSSDLLVEYLDLSGGPIPSGQMLATIGSNSVYKVRISNRGEVAASGVRIREFLPKSTGPLAPTMTTVSCVNELTAQNCNVDAYGALAQNLPTLDAGDSVTYTLTRKVVGSTPVSAANGALTSVAAFVNPDAVAEEDARNNSRRLQIGLVTNGLPVAAPFNVWTDEDSSAAATLSGTDPDGDAIVAWNVATAPAHGSLSGTAPNLTYTPAADYSGVDSFTYRVTDDEGGVSIPATVSITINPINDGPRIGTQLGNVTFAEGDEVAISTAGTFSDPEGNPYTVSVSGLPPGVSYFSLVNAITGNLSLNSSGVYTVILTATETATGLTATQQFTLTVSNTNLNPTVATPIPDRNADAEGDAVAFSVASHFADADAGDVLTFSVVNGSLPTGLSLASDGQISGTIGQTAALGNPHNITIRADDGQGGTVDDSFVWSVVAVNAAPQAVGSIPNQTDTVNTPFLMSASLVTNAFTDPDGDTLSYSASGLPAGVFIDESTNPGLIFGSTTATGTYLVVVTATDPGMLTATQSFTITINP